MADESRYLVSLHRPVVSILVLLVYNWTTDDVIHWVVNHVHLAIYAEYFRRNQIDGRMIPR